MTAAEIVTPFGPGALIASPALMEVIRSLSTEAPETPTYGGTYTAISA
jgi:hypothetical protein